MKLKLGTRGSKLALAQTELVITALENSGQGLEVEPIHIKSVGDRKQGTAAASVSDKKDWVYDLELAILSDSIDFAVHSGKDVPTDIEQGTKLLPVLKRANPLDAFIGRINQETGQRYLFGEIPKNSKVGTASLRRRAQLLRTRPDLEIVEHRGNVPTRLRKLDESEDIMGVVLACAGLERLNFEDIDYHSFPPSELMPALNQGTLAVQFRAEDDDLADIFSAIIDIDTLACWDAERAVAEILEGDCKSAISIFAQTEDNSISLSARVMSPDGIDCIEAENRSEMSKARELGLEVGTELLGKGARKIIEESRNFSF